MIVADDAGDDREEDGGAGADDGSAGAAVEEVSVAAAAAAAAATDPACPTLPTTSRYPLIPQDRRPAGYHSHLWHRDEAADAGREGVDVGAGIEIVIVGNIHLQLSHCFHCHLKVLLVRRDLAAHLQAS